MYTLDLVHARVRELRDAARPLDDLGRRRLHGLARRVRRH